MAKRKAQTPAAAPKSRPVATIIVGAVVAAVVVLGLAVVGYFQFLAPEQRGAVADTSGDEAGSALTETASEPGLVTRVESLYNDIYLYRRASGNYMLSFGARRLRYVESIVNPDDELELPVYYTQSMTAGLAFPEKLERAAIVGLGGGRTAWYVHKSIPDLEFTAVELDPEVARIADRYFGVRAEDNFDIAIRDGRVHLAREEDKTFDVIFIDAYRGPFVPFHLLTTEFYELVGERLEPGGVAVQNVEPTTMLFDSAVATIRAAFDNVAFFSGNGNIVIVAYNGPEIDEATLAARAAERQERYGFRYDLTEIVERRYQPEWDADTEPLTDDWAPVEFLKAIERHNRKQS